MAVTLTGNGGLAVRLGHVAGGCADELALAGGTATARVLSGASMQTRGTTIETDAAYSPAISDVIGDHWSIINSRASSASGFFSSMKALASKILIDQVNKDAKLPVADEVSALRELFRQMRANSDSFNASTVAAGAQTAVGTPVGNPVAVVSLKNYEGWIWQTLLPEIIRLQITGDSQTGATARQEPVSVKGQAAVSDVFSRLWPGGSGASVSLSLVDAQLDNSGGNLLQNSDMETFTTSNVVDNWVYSVGAAGTDIFAAGSSDAYIGSNALKLTGDGATLIKLYQEFNKTASTTVNAGGTPGRLTPSTQYGFHGKIKALSAAPVAGVLRVALVDGSGTVLNDISGGACSFTVDLTGITTSFASFSGTFRTPAALPTTVRLELQTTTAITDTSSIVIDSVAMTPMTALYAGGPSIAVFAGATKVVTGDAWTITTTNTMGVFAAWLERFFSLNSKNLIAPYSGSPTLADALVL